MNMNISDFECHQPKGLQKQIDGKDKNLCVYEECYKEKAGINYCSYHECDIEGCKFLRRKFTYIY